MVNEEDPEGARMPKAVSREALTTPSGTLDANVTIGLTKGDVFDHLRVNA